MDATVKPRLLVVDDALIMRAMIKDVARSAGWDIAGEAANGVEAVARYRELKPDLVTLDIVMPEMDGIELARRATQLDPDLKVMFITGFAAVALNPDSKAPKDAKVLSKPFHLRDLVNEVDKMLDAA